MSIAQEIFKVEGIVPLQAKRAVDGEPDDTHPDVDDRGFLTPEFGPVVSVTKGKMVMVRLTCKRLDDAAPLTAVSSGHRFSFAIAGNINYTDEQIAEVKAFLEQLH